ncbi:S41 family peptidase [Paenibacillus doosanensis]|uniref:CtpA-like serine protease n=1 Tax=Paenibacillus konkukensis TaxID=2020716 RepID=A0ABY4RK45_9BACL|nr:MULTISPECIES: S41 family peptidase [Paenibacillus]MCS7464450.1 S41 family peptidase [Paenibacillus doosanensis]UQZ81682.1 putative CtpA-like serine protease [Paenibacillus konkukensis]
MKPNGYRTLGRRTATALLSLTLLFPAASSVFAAEQTDADSSRIKEVLNLLEKNHVSAPNRTNLSDIAIESMVESLNDPYTVYFTADQLKQFNNALENNYVGIGIKVRSEDNNAYVTEVFDGPAKTAGMLPGDRIAAVDGVSTEGKKLDEVTDKIMGPEGSKVSITVERNQQNIDLDMTRQTIQVPVVTHKMFDQGVGYIRVSGFSSEADEQTAAQLGELKQQGLTSLVLDLRDNPGGLVDTAQNMAKLFVKEGILIHTKDKNNVDEPVKFSGGTTQPFPLYILVNENSASASEVLTGALQDYNVVSKVIGRNTFGKGSVQTLFPLSNGGALKVTIEEYLTPKLRKVNKVGLKPDIDVDGEVPQLVTALQQAGVNTISVELNRRGVSINQIPVEDLFDVVRNDGQLYVPSRVLSSLLAGTVQWNAAAQSVDITANGETHTFAASDGSLLLQNGSSYLNAERFKQYFPQLDYTDSGDKVDLNATKSSGE